MATSTGPSLSLNERTTLLAPMRMVNITAWRSTAGRRTKRRLAYPTPCGSTATSSRTAFQSRSFVAGTNKRRRPNGLTTYTLAGPYEAAGWPQAWAWPVKAATSCLAQRSFSTSVAQDRRAEAYNGLGLASLQAGKPRDARILRRRVESARILPAS